MGSCAIRLWLRFLFSQALNCRDLRDHGCAREGAASVAALHPSLAPRAPSSSPLSSSAPGNCFAEKVRTYHVLYYFTGLRLFLRLLQQALLGVKMLNLRTGFTLYVCFQDKGLGDICICRHGNLSTVKQFPVNPSFETRPSYKHKTTFLFFSLISGLFKKIFFFSMSYFQNPITSSSNLADFLPVLLLWEFVIHLGPPGTRPLNMQT